MTALSIYNSKFLARRPSEDARQYSYRAIKANILRLVLKPGEKMSEIDFAHSLQVSRTPVHESFVKLSRENLVDIIPNQGAYVAKLNCQRINDALWIHSQLGITMLQNIYARNLHASELNTLNYMLSKLEECIDEQKNDQIPRIIIEYYHQLYMAAGNMQYIWESLQKTDGDLQRLLNLIVTNDLIARALLMELTELTNALTERQIDRACSIFRNHITHLSMFLEPIKQFNTDYFVDDNETKEMEDRS